jgi:tRNA dimethylallyltransferase
LKESVRIVAVIGPTAAGKTDIGITLAQETGSEVISVDSMQIYRWMDIGTAKPPPELLAKIPHHLIDILYPDQDYNAGMFANDADAIINQLGQQGKTAVLVGGTGLYLRALINGIIEVPEISLKIRNSVRTLASEKGVGECYLKLKELDPKSADKLHPHDISRVTRALEVVLETGHSIQEYQANHRFQQHRYQVYYIGTTWPREVLYDRINKRVKLMIERGLVNETRGILEMGYSESLPSLNSIGYKQAVAFLRDKMSKDEMITDIQQKSRHYAKKQVTWYKKDRSIPWVEGNRLGSEEIKAIKRFLQGTS